MLQRVRQFRDASIRPAPADMELARRHLPAPLFALFEAQHPRDIVHAARTASWLVERGHDEVELVMAALLHDVGKGHQRRRDRVAFVVAGWPRAGPLLAARSSRWELRRAAERSLTHSESGAAAILAAGGPERVADLVRRHHAKPGGDDMLALLQRADAAS